MGSEVGVEENCDIICFHILMCYCLTAHVARHRRFFLQLNENFSLCV